MLKRQNSTPDCVDSIHEKNYSWENINKYKEIKREYCKTIAKIAPILQKEIREKKEISMSMKNLAEMMGPQFLQPRIIEAPPSGELKYVTDPEEILTLTYWGAKYCLYGHDIDLSTEKKDHEMFIRMKHLVR